MDFQLETIDGFDKLTEAEKKIIQYRTSSTGTFNISTMCEELEISRKTYYTAICKPNFINVMYLVTDIKAKLHYPEVVDSIIGKAVAGQFKQQDLYIDKWGGGKKEGLNFQPLVIITSQGRRELDKINAIEGEVVERIEEPKLIKKRSYVRHKRNNIAAVPGGTV